MEYEYRTIPFEHQRAAFEATRDAPIFACHWEQGTGKTKLIIDTAAYLWLEGQINGVVIIAPNGVHRNWIVDQLPTHLPQAVENDSLAHFYQSVKNATKWHQQATRELIWHQGLSWIAMTYDSPITKHGKTYLYNFLHRRRCLMVLDEASDIKTPGAKRTKTLLAAGKRAKYRRTLDGTPVTNSPFDVYAPYRFLDEAFWRRQHLSTFASFKKYFGIYEQGYNRTQGREFEYVVGYRRVDQLTTMIAPVSQRVTKDDVLDLPPKLYSKIYHELTPEQARLYKDLKDQHMTILESGEMVTTQLPIVRMLRHQQIVCGYIPPDDPDGEPIKDIGTNNPRLQAALQWCDHVAHKALIWIRFIRDADLLCAALGDRAVRYDGTVDEEQRADAIDRFMKDESVQFFVSNPAAGGRGLTLTAARSELYYSNSFKLRDRLQSEDRAHRAGQQFSVDITDIVCPGTVDEHIVTALRNKQEIAALVTGDALKDWL